MKNYQFANVFATRRKELGVTQEQVSNYIGVSRAAVSKWENGLSYPDITILPKLATYFNVSIDTLLGYEPQMTKEHIIKIYAQLANQFATQPFAEVNLQMEQLLSEYYSCFPFVLKMAQLYANYYKVADNPEAILEKILTLCERVKTFSEDYQLVNEAVMMQALTYILKEEPATVLELLGNDVAMQLGTDQLVATAQMMLGKTEKAKEILQVSMYQQLLSMISSGTESLLLEVSNEHYFDETVRRIELIISTFNITKLNVNTALVFYLKAAAGYMIQNRPQKALEILATYMKICTKIQFPLQLQGDDYFYLLLDWIEREVQLSRQAPRDDMSIKKDLLYSVSKNPVFESLQEDRTFKAMLLNLQHQLQVGEE